MDAKTVGRKTERCSAKGEASKRPLTIAQREALAKARMEAEGLLVRSSASRATKAAARKLIKDWEPLQIPGVRLSEEIIKARR